MFVSILASASVKFDDPSKVDPGLIALPSSYGKSSSKIHGVAPVDHTPNQQAISEHTAGLVPGVPIGR